jgi:cytochrome P450 PksS
MTGETDPDNAIEELLRYTSPADFASPRVAREDVVVNGTAIRKGDIVLLILGSANHDETRFEDADALDLRRNIVRTLAFGTGIHYCLGAPLARLEGKVALTKLHRRFPDLTVAVPLQSIRWRSGLAFRGPQRLPVTTRR